MGQTEGIVADYSFLLLLDPVWSLFVQFHVIGWFCSIFFCCANRLPLCSSEERLQWKLRASLSAGAHQCKSSRGEQTHTSHRCCFTRVSNLSSVRGVLVPVTVVTWLVLSDCRGGAVLILQPAEKEAVWVQLWTLVVRHAHQHPALRSPTPTQPPHERVQHQQVSVSCNDMAGKIWASGLSLISSFLLAQIWLCQSAYMDFKPWHHCYIIILQLSFINVKCNNIWNTLQSPVTRN